MNRTLGYPVKVREPIHVIGGGLAGTEAAWQIARRGSRGAARDAAGAAHAGAPDRPPGRTGVQQLAEIGIRNPPRPGCSSRNCGGWIRCCSRAADRARVPGGHALTVDRDIFAREVTGAIAAEPLIELRREEVTVDSGRRDLDHRHRTAHQRRAGAGDPAAHRLGPAVFLRQHQPDRGCGYGGHATSRSGRRATANRSTAPTII